MPYLLQRLAFLRAEVNELLLACPLSPRFRVFLLSHATVSRFTPQNHPDRVLASAPRGDENSTEHNRATDKMRDRNSLTEEHIRDANRHYWN